MKRRVLITLGLFVAMIPFIACNNDDPKPDPKPVPVTVSYCIESSSVNQEPERKFIFDFNIKDYGWVTYNIPDGIEVLSQTQNTEWNMAFDYPYIITNSVDLGKIMSGELAVDFEQYSLIVIGSSFGNSACSYELNVSVTKNNYSVDFILYNPPVYLCDIISGYILLKIPKATSETVVNYNTVQYQLYE